MHYSRCCRRTGENLETPSSLRLEDRRDGTYTPNCILPLSHLPSLSEDIYMKGPVATASHIGAAKYGLKMTSLLISIVTKSTSWLLKCQGLRWDHQPTLPATERPSRRSRIDWMKTQERSTKQRQRNGLSIGHLLRSRCGKWLPIILRDKA